MAYYDFHSHILPGIDDGAKDVSISKGQLETLKAQGVTHTVLTSHYWCWNEPVSEFLVRRSKALKRLSEVYDADRMPKVSLGSEVALRPGISKHHCEYLKFCGDYILLEMPNEYGSWIESELEHFFLRGFKPVIAHIERPYMNFSKSDFEKIMDSRSIIYQMNVAALEDRRLRKYFLQRYAEGFRFILGSDTHNLSGRRPDFDSKALTHRKVAGDFMSSVTYNSKKILQEWENCL